MVGPENSIFKAAYNKWQKVQADGTLPRYAFDYTIYKHNTEPLQRVVEFSNIRTVIDEDSGSGDVNLKFKKVDESTGDELTGAEITIANMYNVKSITTPNLTIDEAETNIVLENSSLGTLKISVTENTAPTGYKSFGTQNITITYDKNDPNKKITGVSGSPYARLDEDTIVLTNKNDSSSPLPTEEVSIINLKIKKVDSSDTSILLPGAEFEIISAKLYPSFESISNTINSNKANLLNPDPSARQAAIDSIRNVINSFSPAGIWPSDFKLGPTDINRRSFNKFSN